MTRYAALVLSLLVAGAAQAQPNQDLRNPLIDFEGFAAGVVEVRKVREQRRVTEVEFARMAREPGTVVLDARSERLYRLRHVRGATNLSFPDFTAETLARVIPSRESRVLIYCNNNFEGAAASMPAKVMSSALNLSTFVSLHSYGYRNVYELGPAIDVRRSILVFAGSETAAH